MDKIDVCKNCECSETAHPYGDLYCSLHNKTCDFIYECNSNPYMNNKQEEEITMEYKVGDKVKVISEHGGHEFNIGDIVTIIYADDISIICEKSGNTWFLRADEIELYNWQEENEPVKNPSHYTSQVPGIECIDVTQHFNFNRGNIIKYAWRCGDKGNAIQDLEKVIQYAKFEIERLKNV